MHQLNEGRSWHKLHTPMWALILVRCSFTATTLAGGGVSTRLCLVSFVNLKQWHEAERILLELINIEQQLHISELLQDAMACRWRGGDETIARDIA